MVEVTNHPSGSRDLLSNIEELQSQLTQVKDQLKSLTAVVPDISTVSGPPDCSIAAGDTSARVSKLTVDDLASRRTDEHDPYAGPTSSMYSLHTADLRFSNLQALDATSKSSPESLPDFAEHASSGEPTKMQSQSLTAYEVEASMESVDIAGADDCIQTVQDVFGVLHPIPCLPEIRAQSSYLLQRAKRSQRIQPATCGECGLVEMFKMIVAIAEVCNEGAPTRLSRALYSSIEPILGGAAFARTITHDLRTLLLLVVR